jgi:hypothetical protein
MNFGQALEALKQGAKIKRPHWAGYWVKSGDTILMNCKTGATLDIRETKDVFYTLSSVAADDWEIVEGTPDLSVMTFSFGEAIRNLKQGRCLARKGWNGKNMWIVLMPALYLPSYSTANTMRKVNDRTAKHIGEDAPLDSQPYIAMWTADGKWQPGWLASQADMLADDWFLVL